ncbi:hypothetical protein ACI2L1_23060 [Streptomyces sp. NPDC019531]|uniref:hypothetical protein n=1 Tax=Streptomyces sp. NPDC019531 TaxID=3365062 RepID=UPI00384A9A2E
MKEFKQPDSLEGIAKALEVVIANIAVSGREDALTTIVSGILYGNNAIDVRQFFDEYPELVDIAEFALEFDIETDAAYLDNRWKLIVDRVHSFTQHVQRNLECQAEL